MKKWEYLTRRFIPNEPAYMESLNKFGAEGWELIATLKWDMNYLIFKREAPHTQEEIDTLKRILSEGM